MDCDCMIFVHVQVWDVVTGSKQYTFEGHEAPVYSVCPHYKENIQVLISCNFTILLC